MIYNKTKPKIPKQRDVWEMILKHRKEWGSKINREVFVGESIDRQERDNPDYTIPYGWRIKFRKRFIREKR